MNQSLQIQEIKARSITSESFQAYGQLIKASVDGKPYDRNDAKLDLTKGIPRFYIMRLQRRGRKFKQITRHLQCTQCLGSLGGKDWYITVAPPSAQDRPDLGQMSAFHIPGDCFIKLEVGTWHAGPYFDWDEVDFYNLELSNTNIVDHFTYDFSKNDNIEFEIV